MADSPERFALRLLRLLCADVQSGLTNLQSQQHPHQHLVSVASLHFAILTGIR